MPDLSLIKPSPEYADEIRAFRAEFAGISENGFIAGAFGLLEAPDIAQWLELCKILETSPFGDMPSCEQYMLADGGSGRIFGMAHFRHELTAQFADGGHIGYCVRPSERRRGYGAKILALCLDKCREYGLDKVLICCTDDNEASRRIILANGGAYERATPDGNRSMERYVIIL